MDGLVRDGAGSLWVESVAREADRASQRSFLRRQQRQRRRARQRLALVSCTVVGVLTIAAIARGSSDRGEMRESQVAESLSVSAPMPTPEVMTIARTVHPGDTWWTLARRYGDPAVPITERVEELTAANGVAASALVPGQRITLIVRNPDELARQSARRG